MLARFSAGDAASCLSSVSPLVATGLLTNASTNAYSAIATRPRIIIIFCRCSGGVSIHVLGFVARPVDAVEARFNVDVSTRTAAYAAYSAAGTLIYYKRTYSHWTRKKGCEVRLCTIDDRQV